MLDGSEELTCTFSEHLNEKTILKAWLHGSVFLKFLFKKLYENME